MLFIFIPVTVLDELVRKLRFRQTTHQSSAWK